MSTPSKTIHFIDRDSIVPCHGRMAVVLHPTTASPPALRASVSAPPARCYPLDPTTHFGIRQSLIPSFVAFLRSKFSAHASNFVCRQLVSALISSANASEICLSPSILRILIHSSGSFYPEFSNPSKVAA
jgi:hypothetical protein